MKLILIAVWFTLLAIVSCYGEEKNSQKPIDFAMYTAIVGTRITDYVTTEDVLDRGGHEDLLPSGLVHNKPLFASYEIGTGGLEVFFLTRLHKHHPLLARSIGIFDISLAAGASTHNALVPGAKKK